MPDFPDVRRARREEQERIGALWMAFLKEQADLDPRIDVADDALERWRNDFPVWLDDETRRIYVAAPEGGTRRKGADREETHPGHQGAHQEETIQGFAMAHRSGPPPIYAAVDEVYLDELYVVPEHRREGLGTQLVHAIRHWAEAISAQRLRLQTMAANEDAQAFWQQVGARPFSTSMTLEFDSRGERPPDTPRLGF